MKIAGQASAEAAGFQPRSVSGRVWGWLAIFCACILQLSAQTPPASAPPLAPAVSATFHGTLVFDGPWHFQVGDDPRWADPGFDDSTWALVTLSQTLSEQAIDSYSGYAWYRLKIQPRQLSQFDNLPGNPQLDLLLTSDSIGQLAAYVNGVESGHTRGMSERPEMYRSPPIVVHVSRPNPNSAIVIAIRTWAGPRFSIGRGLLVKAELGTQGDIAGQLATASDHRWDHSEIAGIILSFLFLCVAILGATLYIAQRHHSEYLWLALLCLSVTLSGTTEIAFGQALIPWSIFNVLIVFAGRVFMAVTLEFILRFTGGGHSRIVRIVQISLLIVPLFSLVHFDQIYEYLSITAEVVFTALVSVLLFRAWRRGLAEAGVMLLPFFLAATADSLDTILDYAAGKHWLPEQFASHRFHFGPIEFSTSILTYGVFLASLIAVILYRFIHISQEEQRSAAEIEAARSVQTMLIPTQLPSNRNFMLESAYLPVNGVGGDFFQVLPLQDGSMLIVVGDVSGKGLQAAMNASTLVGALRNELSHDPATVLTHLNNVLLGAIGSGAIPDTKAVLSFATCLCARIYPDGVMTIANAGHLSPYRDGRELELAADLPLGVIPDHHYEQANFHLNQGDRLIFLSDGVVEATNTEGELFGFERTQQVSNEPARYIAQTAKRFGQTDDITVVSLYFAASKTKSPTREVVHAT
ncbi:MAG: SpoIIE family protein phosphatase [Terracidiphilus sp.]|jgi:hypothetical protein